MADAIKVDLGAMPDEEPIEIFDAGIMDCLRCKIYGLNPDCENCGGTGEHQVMVRVLPPYQPK